jgi:hypothetical protein
MLKQYYIKTYKENSNTYTDVKYNIYTNDNDNVNPSTQWMDFMAIDIYKKTINIFEINDINNINIDNDIIIENSIIYIYTYYPYNEKYDKTMTIIPVINELLGKHFYFLKYIIIKEICKKYYQNTYNKFKTLFYDANKENYPYYLMEIIKTTDNLVNDIVKFIVNKMEINCVVFESKDIDNILNSFNIVKKNIQIKDTRDIFDEKKTLTLQDLSKLDETIENKNIHKITNFIYGTQQYETSCFNMDYNFVEKLISEYKANKNIKDNYGNTLLHYACKLQNIELIKILTKDIKLTSASKNKMGQTPLEYYYKYYIDNIVSNLTNTYIMSKNIRNNIALKLSEKFKNKDIGLSYVKITLPVLFYLLNHQFYLVGLNYPNEWSFELNEKLMNTLGVKHEKYIPISQININDLLDNKNNYNDEINNFMTNIKLLEKENSKIDKDINILNDYFKNLNKDEYNKIKNINDKIHNITKKKTDNNNIITNFKNNILIILQKSFPIDVINMTNIETYLNKYIEKYIGKNINVPNYKNNIRVSDVYDIYDKIYLSDISNKLKNMNIYINIWKTYILQNNVTTHEVNDTAPFSYDHTQIINNIFKYQKNTLTKPENINKMNNIQDYYEKVINPYINNYFELPYTLTKDELNYPLINVINIITHVSKFVFFYFYKIIYKLFYLYNKEIKEQLNIEINDIFEGGLYNIIVNEMPIRAVKIVLQLFNSNDDTDKNDYNKTLIELFNEMIKEQILEIKKLPSAPVSTASTATASTASTTMPPASPASAPASPASTASTPTMHIFDDNNIFIQKLTTEVFPYFKDYLEIFINELKTTTDSYFKLLQTQTIDLKILSLISEVSEN